MPLKVFIFLNVIEKNTTVVQHTLSANVWGKVVGLLTSNHLLFYSM